MLTRRHDGFAPRVVINGRFLARPTTGVERYAREIIRHLDAVFSSQKGVHLDVTLVAPTGTTCDLNLSSIRFETYGSLGGHLWEQTALAWFAREAVLVNLCNSAPVLHRNQIVVIHDAAVYRYPEDYSFRYRAVHKVLGSILSKSAHVCTVSEFSRSELAHWLRIDPRKIRVISNGAEHLKDTAGQSIGLEAGEAGKIPYFLTVGTFSKRKNLRIAIRALALMDERYVRLFVVGGKNAGVFESEEAVPQDSRLVFTGRISDDDLSSLYRGACALVFPSKYEGFGIPLLEAFRAGCPVIAADTAIAREVCGDAAVYFDPDDAVGLSSLITEWIKKIDKEVWLKKGYRQANKYSWAISAKALWTEIEGIIARAP